MFHLDAYQDIVVEALKVAINFSKFFKASNTLETRS